MAAEHRRHRHRATGRAARDALDDAVKDTSNPYFTFDPDAVHRLLALRARLRRGAGHVRADHPGPRLRFEVSPRARTSRSWNPSASRAAPASRPVPTAALIEKSLIALGQPDAGRRRRPAPTAASAARSRRKCKDDAGRAHGAEPRRPRQPRPRLREGPLRLRLRDASGSHHDADDPQAHHRSVARSELGRGDRLRRVASSSASRRSTAATPSAASRRRAARTRRRSSCRSSCARRSATTTSTPARASATRRPATA